MENKSKQTLERLARIERVNRLVDYTIIGILFLFSSIPLITIGVSVSALYKTIYEYKIMNRTKYFSIYFQSFRSSFKQSTLVWLTYFTLIIAFILNKQSLQINYSIIKDILQIIHYILMTLTTPVVFLMLFYIGRFTDSLRTILKNSIVILLIHISKATMVLIGVIFLGLAIWLVPVLSLILPTLMIVKMIEKIEGIFMQFKFEKDKKR